MPYMTPEDHRIFTLFAERVRALEPHARIWAFGSRARGDAEEFSDLDVCVVVPERDAELERKIGDLAWEVGFENERILIEFVFSEDQFERGSLSASPLVKVILREGVPA